MNDTIIPFTLTKDGIAIEDFGNRPQLLKAHADDAAYDLRAAEDYSLAPGDTALVKTGVHLAIPEGFAGLVLPRSGLALKHGITVLNAPGLIDPGYRGEVGVILHHTISNHDLVAIATNNINISDFRIERGDRIAQLLIVRTADIRFAYSPEQTWWITHTTERGEGGFGSTGR